MFRIALGALILCGLSAPSIRAQDPQLLDIMESAIETHPRLLQERAALRAEREAIPLALAPYRPQLNFQASTARSDRTAILSDGQVIDDETSPSTITLDAQQVIWSAGRRDLALRRGILSVRMAEARYAAARQAVQEDALTTYLDLVLASQSLIFQSDAVSVLDQLATATSHRLEREQATRTELAQAEARLAAARANQASATANLATLYARVERVSGFRPAELAWPTIDALDLPIDDLVDQTLHHSHELAEARLRADAARVDMMIASRRNGPSITLGAQRSESENVSPAIISDDETQVNLTLSIPLLGGGENAARRRQAAASRSASRFAVRDLEAETALQMRQIWFQLEAAQLSEEAQRERVQAAELALEGVERGREAGLWSLIDSLDAAEQLTQARQAHAEALRNLLVARGQALILAGEWPIP